MLDGLLRWFQQLDFTWLLETGMIVVASLLCIMVHEICHGLAALALGDDTAKKQGRLSLNPYRHIDPIGLIMMAIARFGWAKPVAVNPLRFRNPKIGMAITAVAGPASNVILALLALIVRAVLYGVFLTSTVPAIEYLIMFFEYVAVLSAGLAVFNLFPIPPLDGSKILFAVLPDRAYAALMRYERFGMILLAVLLISGILDKPLLFLRSGLLDGLISLTMPFFTLFL